MAVTRVDPFALSDQEVYDELCRPGVKRVLAEGDSWLSIFLPGHGNLITWLESRHDVVVLDLSYPGDRLTDMANGRQFRLFRRLISDERHGWPFDAMLLNGGGNDLIVGGLQRVLKKPPRSGRAQRKAEDWIDLKALDRLLDDIEGSFLSFIRARSDSTLNGECPILSWTYDFITPRDCGAQLLGVTVEGPWICPRLNEAGIESADLQKKIIDALLISYRTRLHELSADPVNALHVVDTQGTLMPASPEDLASEGDWADEIHPSARGWRKLAGRIGPALDALLDGQAI